MKKLTDGTTMAVLLGLIVLVLMIAGVMLTAQVGRLDTQIAIMQDKQVDLQEQLTMRAVQIDRLKKRVARAEAAATATPVPVKQERSEGFISRWAKKIGLERLSSILP